MKNQRLRTESLRELHLRGGLLLALLLHHPSVVWGEARFQSNTEAVAPGTVPLLPRAQPPFNPEDQGQSSTGGTSQRNERIQQLVRLAMAKPPASVAPRRAPSAQIAAGSDLKAMTPGQASWLLGLIYLHGQGVSLNTAQAEQWFKQAWNQQERIASAGLAWCALEGCSGPANPAQAKKWIEVLRQQQPGRALYLDWLLARKLAPVEAISSTRSGPPQELGALLSRALALGDVQAQAAMGRQLFTEDRFALALQQFTAAAPHSPAAARNVELVKARLALESGVGMDIRTPLRPHLDAEVVYIQARRLHRGEGVPANYTEALRLYMLADRLGNREASKMLSLIYSRPQASGGLDIAWMQQLADMDISLPSPRMQQPSHPLVLHEDITPLMDWLPATWRQ